MGRDTGAGVTDKRGRPQQQCRADTKCVLKGPLGATLEVITVLLQNISIQNNYGGTHTSTSSSITTVRKSVALYKC